MGVPIWYLTLLTCVCILLVGILFTLLPHVSTDLLFYDIGLYYLMWLILSWGDFFGIILIHTCNGGDMAILTALSRVDVEGPTSVFGVTKSWDTDYYQG